MKAVTIPRFGGPEVLTVQELPDPSPRPDEVVVRVRAATVNPTDLGLRAGAWPLKTPPPYIPGMELAGTVEAVGAWVTDVRIGMRVLGIVVPQRPAGGAQAELVPLPWDSVAEIPEGITWEEAATLPMNGLTVYRALDLLNLPRGATLGVTGSAGAVGGYAIQMGRERGLRIIADAAPQDVDLIRSLGADTVVERGEEVAARMREVYPDGVDALLDASVQGEEVLGAVRDGGQMAVVRGWRGESRRGIQIHPVSVVDYARNRDALTDLARLAQRGVLTLRVAATMRPAEAGEAHRRFAAGGVRGRLVILF